MKLNCPVKSVKGPENSVIGKWKLVKIVLDNDAKVEDHSCRSKGSEIIYHFRSDGKVVTGTKSPYGIPGISPYELRLSPLNGTSEEKYTLKIEDIEYACSIDKGGEMMTINSIPVDINIKHVHRHIKYFIRIE